jgi:hypothetical protein
MKTGLDVLGTAQNESGRTKHENKSLCPLCRRISVRERKTCKRDTTSSVPSKMSLGAQNMKTRPDAFGTAQNESGSEKHENWTRRPRYRRKQVRERKTCKRGSTSSVPPKMSLGAQIIKMGVSALGTTENEFGSAKHENETQCPRYHRKRVWERKT